MIGETGPECTWWEGALILAHCLVFSTDQCAMLPMHISGESKDDSQLTIPNLTNDTCSTIQLVKVPPVIANART